MERDQLEPPDATRAIEDSVDISNVEGSDNARQYIVGRGTITVAETVRAVPAVPRQLPMDVADFIGRESELTRLDQLQASESNKVSSIVITGPAGVGKTGLAIHWGHKTREKFPDGDLYINLRGYDHERPVTAFEALGVLLGGFGAKEEDLPCDVAGRINRYRSLMHGRRMLLLIDNASSIDDLQALLPGSASTVLITSRHQFTGSLAMFGSRRLKLSIHSKQSSVRLLRNLIDDPRCQETDAVAALAKACDGLVLALRIVAANAVNRHWLSLGRIADELHASLKSDAGLSAFDTRDGAHTSLPTVLSWSIQPLDENTQRFFALLGISPVNEFSPEVLASMAGVGIDEAAESVDRLVRMNLIEHRGGTRYGMHGLVRAHARHLGSRLSTEQHNRSLKQLLEFYRSSALAAMDVYAPFEHSRRPAHGNPEVSPSFETSQDAFEWLESERRNIVTIALFAEQNDWRKYPADFARTLFRFFVNRGHSDDAEKLLSAGARTASVEQRADALCDLGVVYAHTGRNPNALECYQTAHALAVRLGQRTVEARALSNMAAVLRFKDTRAAIEIALRSVEIARDVDCASELGRILNNCGSMYLFDGQYEEALSYHQEALSMFRSMHYAHGEAAALGNVGASYIAIGSPERSIEHLKRAIGLLADNGERSSQARTLNSLANATRELGRPYEAIVMHKAAIALGQNIGDINRIVTAMVDLGISLKHREHNDESVSQLREAAQLAEDHGLIYERLRAQTHLDDDDQTR